MNIAKHLTTQLEKANKLIFAQQYTKALEILNAIICDKEGSQFLLAHLRYIELATRLDQTDKIRADYLKKIQLSQLDVATGQLCIALIEQHAKTLSPANSINKYLDIMKDHGESAAAFYGIGLSLEAENHYDRAIYNYQQSIQKDSNWYPSYFGLSQIYYRLNDSPVGDQYFYLFEGLAPYNLYGNINTHRRLSEEFLNNKQYDEAKKSITSLSEWWLSNQKIIPNEILILESLSLAHIAELEAHDEEKSTQIIRLNFLLDKILTDQTCSRDTLFFLAKFFKEFHRPDLLLKSYERILTDREQNPTEIQTIGSELLAEHNPKETEKLFKSAYASHPDNPDIRYYLLASRLQIAKVDLDYYFKIKNIVTDSVEKNNNHNESLKYLNKILTIYKDDPDIHNLIANIHLNSGNVIEAALHLKKMYELDKKSTISSLNYAAFLISSRQLEIAKQLFDEIEESGVPNKNIEYLLLKAKFFEQLKDYENAAIYAKKALENDPWDIKALSQIIRYHLQANENNKKVEDPTKIFDFNNMNANDWKVFDDTTESLVQSHHYDIAYVRGKFRLLSNHGHSNHILDLVRIGEKFNLSKSISDILKLLNTNLDSPWLYWALGFLYKEMGSLETAETWFQHLIDDQSLPFELKIQVHIDLSETYLWRNIKLEKVIAYAQVVEGVQTEQAERAKLIMAHAYLKLGQVRIAQTCLDEISKPESNLEKTYLQGLLFYRDGSIQKAKEIWKPLLTIKAQKIKEHWIKKEIFDFYFEEKSYMKNN